MPDNPDSLDLAIQQTCHDYRGGVQALATDLSMSPGTLYNKCNPGMTTHRLNLQEALDIMRLAQDFRILEVLCRRTHHACVSSYRFRQVGDKELLDAWTACDMEHGKTAGTIREALEDHRIIEAEFRRIRSEMFLEFARELELLDRLRRHANLPDSSPSASEASIQDAVAATINNNSRDFKDLAKIVDIREPELRKKANSTNTDRVLTLLDTLKLMHATDDFTILHTLAAQLEHRCIAVQPYNGIDDMALLDAWSGWNDQRSDTVKMIHSALLDGAIESREIEQIEREMSGDFQTELALLARLQRMIC